VGKLTSTGVKKSSQWSGPRTHQNRRERGQRRLRAHHDQSPQQYGQQRQCTHITTRNAECDVPFL